MSQVLESEAPPAEILAGYVGCHEDTAREALQDLDDSQVVEALAYPRVHFFARQELASRRRFECAWSGTWSSGPNTRVLRPEGRRGGKVSFSGGLQRRKAFQGLLSMAHSENKAARDSARFLLKRDHNYSLS